MTKQRKHLRKSKNGKVFKAGKKPIDWKNEDKINALLNLTPQDKFEKLLSEFSIEYRINGEERKPIEELQAQLSKALRHTPKKEVNYFYNKYVEQEPEEFFAAGSRVRKKKKIRRGSIIGGYPSELREEVLRRIKLIGVSYDARDQIMRDLKANTGFKNRLEIDDMDIEDAVDDVFRTEAKDKNLFK